MKHVDIYTDGACKGNPGPGGYGAILVYGGQERELSGGEPSTTNNRMELMGAIAALERLREPCEVTLTSDSRYLVDAVTKGWAKSWRRGEARALNRVSAYVFRFFCRRVSYARTKFAVVLYGLFCVHFALRRVVRFRDCQL